MNTENTESTQSTQSTQSTPETFAREQAKAASKHRDLVETKLDEVSAMAGKTAAEMKEASIKLDALLEGSRPVSTETAFGKFLASANNFLDKAIYVMKPVAATVAVIGGVAVGGRAVYRKVTAKAAPAVLPTAPTPDVTL